MQKDIEKFVDEVARKFRPEKIILFGSQSISRATAESDVDLLVIMDFEGRPQMQALSIRRQVDRNFPLDLIVRRPAEVDNRLAEGDFFLKDIVENGKVLYERSGSRVGQ